MSHCDVMIKDVADSKRIGKLIQEEIAAQANEFNANGFTLRVMVLSKFFWPKFKSKESFLLPKQLQHAFAYFQDRFKILKASRTVDLVPQLGSVTLELKLEGSTVNNEFPNATYVRLSCRGCRWNTRYPPLWQRYSCYLRRNRHGRWQSWKKPWRCDPYARIKSSII